MHPMLFLAVLLGLSAFAYQVGRRRSVTVAGGLQHAGTLHSRP